MENTKDKWLSIPEFVALGILPITEKQFRVLLHKREQNGLDEYVRRVHNRLWTTVPLMLKWWDTQKGAKRECKPMSRTWDRKGGRPKKVIPAAMEPVKLDPAVAPIKQAPPKTPFIEPGYDASQVKGRAKIFVKDLDELKKIMERYNIELI